MGSTYVFDLVGVVAGEMVRRREEVCAREKGRRKEHRYIVMSSKCHRGDCVNLELGGAGVRQS